jgi:hypothetical protein
MDCIGGMHGMICWAMEHRQSMSVNSKQRM